TLESRGMHGFTQDGGPEPRLDRVRQDPIDATQSPRRSPRGSAGCPLGSVASTPRPYGSAAGWWRRAESARRGHSVFREVPRILVAVVRPTRPDRTLARAAALRHAPRAARPLRRTVSWVEPAMAPATGAG